MCDRKEFQKLYPFTTKDISGYIKLFDLDGSDVLTVGSSGDQAFNSLLLNAKSVTIFDINQNTKKFIKEKRKLILTTPREQLYNSVLSMKKFAYSDDVFSKKELEKMNLYLKDDEAYHQLREKIKAKEIIVKNGDVFKKLDNLSNKKYDYIFLSNVLQYLNSNETEIGKSVVEIFNHLSEHLNENGIIQLYYLYGSLYPKKFASILNEFLKYGIFLEKQQCENSNDSIITIKKYTKKKMI